MADHYAPTRYGFEWGPLAVERLAHIEDRGYVIGIKTEHQTIQIYVSEKGRKIKAYPVRKRVHYADPEAVSNLSSTESARPEEG